MDRMGRWDSLPLLLLVASCIATCDGSPLSSTAVDVEAPLIDPASGAYTNEVVVRITPNQVNSHTYFTLDGNDPTDRDEILVEGTEIVLSRPGHHVVKAVTYPDLNSDILTRSVITTVEYNLTQGPLPHPVASPASDIFGKLFRGPVSVELSHATNLVNDTESLKGLGILYLVTYMPTLSTLGASGALPPPQPNAKWTLYAGKPILFGDPGTYILRTQAYNASINPMVRSARGRFVYRVQPPLVYDVSTECCEDPHQPVLGSTFTVWLSNAVRPSSLFLTISAKGCEKDRHLLDDTEKVTAAPRQMAFRFSSCTEAQSKVFVCLREEDSNTYRLVPRRRPSQDSENGHSFSIAAPKSPGHSTGSRCNPSTGGAHTTAPKNHNATEGGSMWVSLLFLFCGALLFGFFLYVRNFCGKLPAVGNSRGAQGHHGHTHRREDRVELLQKAPTARAVDVA